ncbi:hypothetical protein ACEWY4_025512 [Coilia grayii]|uniref:RING-type domain-containing protein n=1 Tax=Coilia grayii TaxID=363190 RepID=A0ABD1IXT3_9TELE
MTHCFVLVAYSESGDQGEDMELECGVCYQIYNAGRRCPRELKCKHSFCECCLKLLAQSAAHVTEGCHDVPAEVTVLCPLCRYPTILVLADEVRGQLPVDEDLFEHLLSSGILNDSMFDDDDGDPEEFEQVVSKCEERTDDTLGTEAVPRSRGRRLWRSFKRFCGKVIGDSGVRDRRDVLTDEDMRDLVLMSCMM